jgi:hypothetical protein
MNNSRNIIGVGVFAGALIFSIWLGVNIVTDQAETIIKVIGCLTLIACALLGRRIWMIIPLMGGINLSLAIPGQPSTALVGQTLFIGFCVLLFMTRKLQIQPAFTELGFWVLLLCFCVLQTYLRNPVGLNIFGGQSVGARPYALFAASLISCMILSTFRIPAEELKYIIKISILGSIINFAVQSVAIFVPQVERLVGGSSLATQDQGLADRGQYGETFATRIGFLGYASRSLSLLTSSYISPLRACFSPFWAPIMLITIAFAAISGFRNEIAAIGLTYLVSIAYRGGFASVLISSIALTMGVALLAVINLALPLPANAQRALSFLPGTWDQTHIDDSKGSTDWRVDMWEEALFTDFWIHNKTLGDGLGMTKQELNYIQSFTYKQSELITGSGKLSRQQEFMMASGAYHSGPVSTIRVIGYLGLAILLFAQIRLAVHAHRQVRRARNTEWFPLTLFIGIPLIWSPFFFVFIGGDFSSSASSLLLGVAMVRILENNLPLPVYSKFHVLPSTFQTLRHSHLDRQLSGSSRPKKLEG